GQRSPPKGVAPLRRSSQILLYHPAKRPVGDRAACENQLRAFRPEGGQNGCARLYNEATDQKALRWGREVSELLEFQLPQNEIPHQALHIFANTSSRPSSRCSSHYEWKMQQIPCLKWVESRNVGVAT